MASRSTATATADAPASTPMWPRSDGLVARGNVLVVGGSAGIGLAIAHQFAAHGHDLVLVARDAARLQQAARELASAHGIKVTPLAIDAAGGDAAARLIASLDREATALRYAVIGAGIWQSGPADHLEPAALRQLLEVNVVAHHALFQALMPRLPAGGGILFIGSLAGCLPLPWLGGYAASKACLHASVTGWRLETAGRDINVCLLAPGVVLTDFLPRPDGVRWRWLLDGLASSPETVARAAYRGLMANMAVIVPGMVWRLTWLGTRILPAGLLMRLANWMLRPLAPVAALAADRATTP